MTEDPSKIDRPQVIVHCKRCWDAPVVDTPDPEADTDKCLRCQQRHLKEPHPQDHLCKVCRAQCPLCRAPGEVPSGDADEGGGKVCRRCLTLCRTCGEEVKAVVYQVPPSVTEQNLASAYQHPRPSTPTPADAARQALEPKEPDPDAHLPLSVRRHLAALGALAPRDAEIARRAASVLYPQDETQAPASGKHAAAKAAALWLALADRHEKTVAAWLADHPQVYPSPAAPPVVPPPRRKRSRRYHRAWFGRSSWEGQCESCRAAASRSSAGDPVRAVLAVLPPRVVRVCGATLPRTVIDLIRSELRCRDAADLIRRVDRRLASRRFAHARIERQGDKDERGEQRRDGAEEGVEKKARREPSVAAEAFLLALLEPHPCLAGCEDGWDPRDPDKRCPSCAPSPLPRVDVGGADRRWRECAGRRGSCGRPVPDHQPLCPECAGWPVCCSARHDPAYPCPSCGGRPVPALPQTMPPPRPRPAEMAVADEAPEPVCPGLPGRARCGRPLLAAGVLCIRCRVAQEAAAAPSRGRREQREKETAPPCPGLPGDQQCGQPQRGATGLCWRHLAAREAD
ncbi:hypothetical protein [Streptomyces sp. SM12]|uniref:hypothetical protein n=1 Tax=Streptomyces sp. SM12 TaxID=1071602 RepID=UPI000CD55A20|nr:hypothetical protein [Streptomyces sp. SM12]